MLNFFRNKVNIYLALFVIYDLALAFGAKGVITTVINYFLILSSVYYAIYANVRYKVPPPVKALNVFAFLMIVYGVVLIIKGTELFVTEGREWRYVNPDQFLKRFVVSILPFYAFYVYTKKGLIDVRLIHRWIWVFFIASAIQFIIFNNQVVARSTSSLAGITNNYAYLFTALIPFVMVIPSKSVMKRMLWLALCLAFCMYGAKRGAIIISALCLIVFILYSIKDGSGGHRLIYIVMSIFAIFAIYYAYGYLLQENEYFASRMEKTSEGDIGHRSELYEYFLYYFLHSDPVNFLFGHGANATLTIYDNYAHNDWLELAIDEGLLGVLIYATFLFQVFRSTRLAPKGDLRTMMQMIFIIMMVKTFFSMSFTTQTYYFNMILAYSIAQTELYKSRYPSPKNSKLQVYSTSVSTE